ncbi:MAG: FliA/WhiG family RNA polymerase sigma factor [Myxococcota bacterium]|nr:FliA/WhiG family RNA polymerase sigma factor [Myxococcota bacterium]
MSALLKHNASRQDKITQYAPLVEHIVMKLRHSLPSYIETDDLRQIGYIGLIQAVDRYQETKGCSLEHYAKIRIQGSIIDELRSKDWVPRSVRARIKTLQAAQTELHARLNRKPTEEEVAEYLGMTKSEYRRMYKRCDARVVLSMENGIEEDNRLGDKIPGNKMDPQSESILNEEIGYLKVAMNTLSQREHKIVNLYYYQNWTFKKIAEEMQVTEARISQLHTRIKQKLLVAHKRNAHKR